jgi:ureidoglycolate lyase
MPLTLTPLPLNAEAFAPFGDVIETKDAKVMSINEGTTERFHDLAEVDTGDGGHALINIFRGQPRPQPIEIKMMENHPIGSQAFTPMKPAVYLVVVAPAGPPPGPDDLVCFTARADQGVNYHAGVWHHPLLVLEADHDFLVVDRGGPGDNLEEYWFSDDQGIALVKV